MGGHRRRARSAALTLWFALTVGLAAGCGSAPSGGGTAADVAGSATTPRPLPSGSSQPGVHPRVGTVPSGGPRPDHAPDDPAHRPSTASPAETHHRSRGTRIFAWVVDLAPLSGGATSLEDSTVASLADGSCRGPGEPLTGFAGPVRSLYVAGLSACLAALHGRPELWRTAERALQATAGHVGGFDCRQRAVLSFTRHLLEAHREAPDARFARGRAAASGYGTCPVIGGLNPTHGDADGGYPVRFTGENLPNRVRVHLLTFAGSRAYETVQVVATDGRQGTITMIASRDPGSRDDYVTVWAEGWPHGPMGAPVFAFDAGGRTASSSTTTTTTTATTTTTQAAKKATTPTASTATPSTATVGSGPESSDG